MQDSEQRMGMVPGPNPCGTVPEDEMEPWELRGRSGDGHVLGEPSVCRKEVVIALRDTGLRSFCAKENNKEPGS